MSNYYDKQGYLYYPETAEIQTVEDEEFATDYAVRPDRACYLFSTLPEKESLDDVNATLTPIGQTEFPAILEDKHGQMVGVHGTLTSEHRFLARRIKGNSEYLEVVVYEPAPDVDPAMPETGREIKVINKGYVKASDVRPAVNHRGEFKSVRGDIFPNASLIDDVRQNTFGDCFLLASILSILHRKDGEKYIKSMMIQDGDYTIVRLYHPDTHEPHYIRVKNSEYHFNRENQIKHHAPWVHILEKAYTAMGFVTEELKDKKTKLIKKAVSSFQEIFGRGGHAEIATSMLTGIKTQTQSLKWAEDRLCPISWLAHQEIAENDPYIAKMAIRYGLLQKLMGHSHVFYEVIRMIDDKIKRDGEQACKNELTELQDKEPQESERYNQLRLISEMMEVYCDFKDDQHALHEVVKSFSEFAALSAFIDKVLRDQDDALQAAFYQQRDAIRTDEQVCELLRHFERFSELPSAVKERLYHYRNANLHKWARSMTQDPYSAELNNIFDTIEDALKNDPHAILTASTKKDFKDVAGLRNSHVYALIGVTRKIINGQEKKYIQVYNPWGHTGRAYDHAKEIAGLQEAAVEVSSAVSDVELVDFFNIFNKFTIGQYPGVVDKNQIQVRDYVRQVELLQYRCVDFFSDLNLKIPNADRRQKDLLEKQMIVVGLAKAKLDRCDAFCTVTTLRKQIKKFQDIVNENAELLQKSNDGAGLKFLKAVATILSFGLLYGFLWRNNSQHRFVTQVSRTDVSNPRPLSS